MGSKNQVGSFRRGSNPENGGQSPGPSGGGLRGNKGLGTPGGHGGGKKPPRGVRKSPLSGGVEGTKGFVGGPNVATLSRGK